MSRTVASALVISLAFACALAAQPPSRVFEPEGAFYYQPAASVFGSEAVWVNPAALGRFSVTGFQVMADYADRSFGKDWGILAQREHVSIAYRNIRYPGGPNYHEYIYAAGFPMGQGFGIGVSYQYYRQAPGDLNKLHSWTLSAQRIGIGDFSWGAVFSNLNRATVNGVRTEVEQRYSLAYRAFNDHLTIAADMFLTTKMRLPNATYVYHAEITTLPGLYVDGFIDSHQNFQLGIRANLLQYFIGNKSSFPKGGGRRTNVYGGWYNLMQPSIIPAPPKKLSMNLGGSLPENPPQPIFGARQQPFVSHLRSIYRAADDPSVTRLLVKIRGASFGFAKAQELRDAFSYFKSRGKRLYCYLSEPSNLSYFLASAADTIAIPPVSQLGLVGLRAEQTFYGGTLEKIGVSIELLKIGEYKSAAEAYTRAEPSAENRAQVNRILDKMYGQFVSGVANRRGLSIDSAKRVIDNGPYTSAEALDAKLVDLLCYEDQLDSCLALCGAVSMASYQADTLINRDWHPRPVIALVVAEGEITSDKGDISPLNRAGDVTPSGMAAGLNAANANPRVAGVVLRINSPGGSAIASDDIYHAEEKIARKRPLVVSMGNLAASGGYYIAMPAKRLFADPTTITGSIGIFGGKADYSGLYKKIALGKELYTRGRFAGMMTSVRPFSEEERQKYFGNLKAFYDHFVDLVSDNRRITADSVNSLGRGQVWTGAEALANGLVDELGGLKQSLDYSAKSLDIAEYDVQVYPRKRPLFIMPTTGVLDLIGLLFGVSHISPVEDEVTHLCQLAADPIQARMPYDIVVE